MSKRIRTGNMPPQADETHEDKVKRTRRSKKIRKFNQKITCYIKIDKNTLLCFESRKKRSKRARELKKQGLVFKLIPRK